jgi:phosphomannomutase
MNDESATSLRELTTQVEAWIADDPDPDTRAELIELSGRAATGDKDARDELADRFSGSLKFGTAGLRGPIGAGPNRMNRVVVIKAAAGLAAYVREAGTSGAPGRVVIGYDARHKSDVFAADTAAVMSGAGLDAVLLPKPLPTPVLAFAIRHLSAVAGVMVTASHNPPGDNGYKVYLGDGSQIVPPADREIAARIAAVASGTAVPRGTDWRTAGDELLEAYIGAVAGLVEPTSPRELRTVYTPLHGVGDVVVHHVLASAGFPEPVTVTRQQLPDPDFPTVSFPNPEEPGAMDLALELAERESPDLVIANDPDADRCAVAVPSLRGWRVLRGDELGILLADAVSRRAPAGGGVLATTIVSSSMLSRLAPARGFEYAETLTGFKWIGRVPGLVFGYEEALGYCVAPDLVRDKDGISALLLVAEIAATLKSEGRTLLDRLDDLYAEFGVHATDQLSVRVDDLALITEAMTRLRNSPPESLGGLDVTQVDDLSEGVEGLPPTEGLRYRLSGGGRVVVRPSGTEPKLKCYLEVVSPVADGVAAAQVAAAGRLDAIRADLSAVLGLYDRPDVATK